MSTYPTIRIEGGLFSPDILDSVAAGDLPGQKPADFGLESKRNLTDEISAVFNDARTQWSVFQNRLSRLSNQADPATSVTRDAWMIPLLGFLGFELRYNPKAHDVDGRSYAISHRAGEDEDAPPIHIVGARQELGRIASSGRPRLSPHSLVQEYLNRTEHLWGIVTNGLVFRLVRDSSFIRRQAYLEFDLQAMIEEQRYLDFAVFYRLLHRSRFPRGLADGPASCLEKYYARSIEQGGRVREHLRDGVEQCLQILADGFLKNDKNGDLKQKIAAGSLSPENLYKQLLKIIYRFLFLLVAEDRGLISRDPVYREHYGVGRLRKLLEKKASFSDNDDLWMGLGVLWNVFGDERLSALLSLAPLNGELFSPQELDDFRISNADLLKGFHHLAKYHERPSCPARNVNYSALDVEEMGSVYESLLEFHPLIETDGSGRMRFYLAGGSERKTTGSYYTPPELVNELVQSALEPALHARLKSAVKPGDKERAILALKVCDPACGSGHFLLAASRRLGKELARIRTEEDEPSPERVRECTRDVISHCIYGVDKNPLAADLCRVALWIEGHTEGKPLTFLDHRIRSGDSLVGVFDLKALKAGIPDEAFKSLEGDDKKAAREALKQNRFEREEPALFPWDPKGKIEDFGLRDREIDAISDDSPAEIKRKKASFEARYRDPAWRLQKTACDLWTAAFFQKYSPGKPAVTTSAVSETLAGHSVDARLTAEAEVLSSRQGFFHWPLEFPEVFAEGGFGIVLSNPPWERIKVQEQEFFSVRDRAIAKASNKAARARLIKELPNTNRNLYCEFIEALRLSEGASVLMRNSSRFPLAGRGDINTYAVFAELALSLIHSEGRSGIIIPTGIATDDTTKYFFQDIIQKGSLISLYDFENRKKIFSAIDSRMKFCLFTCENTPDSTSKSRIAEFVFFAHEVADLKDESRKFTLSAADIAVLNPNTRNCPIFRSRADAELTKAIYRRVPILWKEERENQPEENPWKIQFSRLFDMANDSHHFRTSKQLIADGYKREGNIFVCPSNRFLPLYEAKMLHQFDHRWATYEEDAKGEPDSRDVTLEEKNDPNFVVQPRYWVREDIVDFAIPDGFKDRQWFMGWRDICRATDERTTISTIFSRAAVGDTFLLIFSKQTSEHCMSFCSTLNSIIQDYAARQKIGGTHMKYNVFRQNPIFSPSFFRIPCQWEINVSIVDWIKLRALELFYTSWDLAPFAKECGYDGPPFPWDEERRFNIRCELDAAFFHLYLPCETNGNWKPAENETASQLDELKRYFPTPRAAVNHILDQFPIVQEKDENKYGFYRTKELILSIYDDMKKAMKGSYRI